MSGKHLSVLFVVIVTQLILIFYLAVKIFLKKPQVIVTKVHNSALVQGSGSKLKYFSEPSPNSIITDVVPWSKKKVVYTINNDSLNEVRDYKIDKSPKFFRIITLGDSYTFGQFINTSDNWAELLESKLNILNCKDIKGFEVINLGVEDYDIQYSLERFKLRGQKYKPDLVIWFLKNDDFISINEQIKPFENKIMKDNNLSYDSPKYLFDNNMYYPIGEEAYKIFSQSNPENEVLKTQEQFLNDFTKEYSGGILFMTLNNSNAKHNKIMEDIAKRSQTFLIKIDLDNAKYRFPDTHPNELGSTKIADTIFDFLKFQLFRQCR
jgi:hypothetical protein